MAKRLALVTILAAVVVTLAAACSQKEASDPSGLKPYSTVEMVSSGSGFMGGVITPTPSSGEFLVIIELTPSKNEEVDQMCRLLRSGHPVLLRLRDQPGATPILVSDVTSAGEVIIRTSTREAAQQIIDRLHAQPIPESRGNHPGGNAPTPE